MHVLKTKQQRLSDALEILNNLKSIGADKDSGYLDTKKQLDIWIQEGFSWSGRIDFPRYGRFAEIILPQRADRKCSCVLRAKDILLQQEKIEKI